MLISSKLLRKFLLTIYVTFSAILLNGIHASDPSVNDYMITDLISTQVADFAQEAARWTANGLVNTNANYTICNLVVLGGVDILHQGGYFERTYSNLPSHNVLYFTIQFTSIDLWNTGDTFLLSFDGVNAISGWSPGLSAMSFTNNYCGTSLNDMIMSVEGKALHTGSTLTLRVTFNLLRSGLTGGLGFRSIEILLATVSPVGSASSCAASTATTLANTVQCPCSSSYYQDPVTGCTQCHNKCQECFDSHSNQCYSYKLGYGYDGSHVFTCSSGCQTCTGTSSNQCTRCDSSHWLYDDQTCRSSCTSPMVSQGVDARTCINLCQSLGEFVLWDGTCISSCNYPLTQTTLIKTKYCNFPCTSGLVLMWDATCTSSCDYPNKLSFLGGEKFCEQPCEDTSFYFYEKDSICRSYCEFPFKVVILASTKVCVFDISENQLDAANRFIDIYSITNPIICALSAFISFLNKRDPIVLFAVGFSELLQYLAYLRVQFPATLYYMLTQQAFASAGFTFLPEAPLSVKNAITRHSLGEKFNDRGLHSSFIVNSWRFLMVLSAVIGILILTVLLKAVFRSFPRARSLIQKIINIIKWNFLLIIFCSDAALIALFTALDFSTVQFDSAGAGFSFFIALGMNIGLLVAIVKSAQIGKDFKTVKNTVRREEQYGRVKMLFKKWTNFQVLFDEFNKQFFVQQMHIAIFILRGYIQFVLIVPLSNQPLMQASIFTGMSFLMLIYLARNKPLIDRLFMLYVSFQEVALFVINICATVLAALDKRGSDDLDARYRIEAAIIWTSLALTAISLVFLAIKLFLTLKEKIQKPQKPVNKAGILKQNRILKAAQSSFGHFTEGRIRARRDPNYYA